jgi:HAD superfamily hydrolase (TIGR01509 family)
MSEAVGSGPRERPGDGLRLVPGKLVIFDCDGVLVDTEETANRFMAKLLTDSGFPIGYEDCRRRFVGRTIEAVQELVERESGLSLGPDWPVTVRLGTERAFQRGVSAVPGAESAILALQAAGIPFCVASSGRFSKMRTSLGKAGLLPYVEDVLFSAEQVVRGKPAPDLFLHAAASMGMMPDAAVVIEDSVPGVEAGIAAGMRVLGYAGDTFTDADALEAAGATVFHDMVNVTALI